MSAILLLLLFFTAPFLGRADESLSLSQCLALAQEHAPSLQQARANQRRAAAALQQAQSLAYPQLSALASLDFSDDPARQLPDANKAVLHLEQNLYPFSPAWYEMEQRRAEFQAVQQALQAAQGELDLQLKQIFFESQRDADSLANLDDVEKKLKALQESVLPRFNMGRSPSFDLVKTRSALADLNRQRDSMRAEMQADLTQLAHLLGKGEAELSLAPFKASLPDLPARFELNPDAVANVQAAQKGLQASQAGLQAARWAWLPGLSAAAEYGYSGQQVDNQQLGWDLGLSLKAPLWDWGGLRAQRVQEEANVQNSTAVLAALKQKVQEDWAAAWRSAQAHFADHARLAALLGDTEQAVGATIQRYRRGAVTIVEAADAISLWQTNFSNERAAAYGYLSDLAKLEQMSGQKFLPNE